MDLGTASLDDLLCDARWLSALARGLTRDAATADDLVQEARVAALTRPPERPSAAWLTRAVQNLARGRGRAERARRVHERAAARGERLDSAAEVVERAELQRWLVGHVLALEEPFRSTILWRHFDGLSSAAIARRAGVPDSTVRTRLARGLEALRARLERERGRSWALALAPLARGGPATAGTHLGLGVVAMKTVFSIGLVLVGLIVLWALRSGSRTEIPGEPTLVERAHRAEPDLSAMPSPLPAAARAASTGTSDTRAVPAADELAGRVVTAAGEPVVGARVRVVLPRARQWPLFFFEELPEAEVPLAETRTDGAGEFHLRVGADHLLDLFAEAEGFARAKRAGIYSGARIELVLARPAALAGRVTRLHDGSPVEGATVVAREGVLSLPGRENLRAVTDARGDYRLADLAPGCYQLRVRSPDQVTASPAARLLAAGEEAIADFALEDGVTITGRVSDGRDESPLAGARVFAWGDRERVVVTNALGEYRLAGVAVGSSADLHVACDGFGTFSTRVAYVGASGARQDFFLLPGRSARGRVIDADGAPVAGASVGAGSLADGMDARAATTGADGRFELTDLRIDLRHSLLVRAPGHACAVFDFPVREFEVPEIDLGDLALEPSTHVSGRLTDLAGRPLEGLLVGASIEPLARDVLGPLEGGEGYLSRGGLGTGAIQAPTDADGRFAFAGLPAGRWTLTAEPKGYLTSAQVELDVTPGERRAGVELALDTGLSITGFVTDEEGRPLPGLVVDIYPEGSDERLVYDLAREDGSFACRGLEPGRYRVSSDGRSLLGDSDRARSERVCGAGEGDVRLRLGRAVRMRVRVVDRLGAPLPGAMVGINVGIDWFSMQRCDEEGRTSVRVPEQGTFDLMACANPSFDPGADFFAAFFRDEQGSLQEEMSVTLRGLRVGPDEVVLAISGLP
ncbi:MAG TPA: sigma-70 family RNA polymerase sigma factor [Planctomycetota bacterium]